MSGPNIRLHDWKWQEKIGVRDKKTLDGDQSVYFNRLMDLGDPIEPYDAAHKKYVDDALLHAGGGGGEEVMIEHLATFDHPAIHPSNIVDGDPVDVTGRDIDDILTWNGTAWVPVSPHNSRWRIEEGTYTATPASTSTITTLIDRTGAIFAGTPICYEIAGVRYIGVVTNITIDTITIAGPPLSGDIQALYLGVSEMIGQVDYVIPGAFSAIAEDELIKTFQKSHSVWRGRPAYLVWIGNIVQVLDSTVQPKINVTINGSAVSTDNGGDGIAIGVVLQSTSVGIDPATYKIENGDVIEVTTTQGGTGDASDLTAFLTFISES